MNNALLIPLFFLLTLAVLYAGTINGPDEAAAQRGLTIIPKPVHVVIGQGTFVLSPATRIVIDPKDEHQKDVATYLVGQLERATGYRVKIVEGSLPPQVLVISFGSTDDEELGEEGYSIDVGREQVSLRAKARAGFFYAVQTFLQLLPPQAFSARAVEHVKWTLPCVSIKDYPRFRWRGMHLDVSRHFFPAEFIKTYIDMLARHKMNVFHWHLTDDQGWRVEIKKYPKLAEVAAWRVDREHQEWNTRDPQREGEMPTYGGFYTQAEIKDIVRYAAERNITIVPEIEMPAHTTALLAAYPQYSCTGGPFTVPPGGVWPITDIFCAGNDSTFSFLEDVLTEVMELFPGTFIHIGGDEADKKEWKVCQKCQGRIRNENLKDEAELQSYFVKRIEKFLNSHNRRLIGWDEILEGGLAPNAAVMSWRGTEGGIDAARQGHDVVMTPGSHCYFNSYQGREELEPVAGGGYLPLKKVYEYEPVPAELTLQEATHILGAQGCLWTEYVLTPNHAQYMTLPRMAALAEVVWSPSEARDWSDFTKRIEHQMNRYEAAGYTYAKSAYNVSISTSVDSVKKQLNVALACEVSDPVIHYRLDGKDPTTSSPRYTMPFVINKTAAIRAGAFRNGMLLGKISEQRVYVHKASFKHVKLEYPYEKYTAGGEYGLTNGLRGSTSFADGNWQGYHQHDVVATVDLGKETSVSKISTCFLENTVSWIFLPVAVEFSVSRDGTAFERVAKFEEPVPSSNRPPQIRTVCHTLDNMRVRYIRVFAQNVGLCPEWHIGAGDKAWVFVDEIIVE